MFDITDKIGISKKVLFKSGKQIYQKKHDKFQDYLLFEFFQALFLHNFLSKSFYSENILTLKITYLTYSKQKYIQSKKNKKVTGNNKSTLFPFGLNFWTHFQQLFESRDEHNFEKEF